MATGPRKERLPWAADKCNPRDEQQGAGGREHR
jgi:hypothetical protein